MVHSNRPILLAGKRIGSRWASRTSNPVSGSRQARGGFDSHALPPGGARAAEGAAGAGGGGDDGAGVGGRGSDGGGRRETGGRRPRAGAGAGAESPHAVR